MTDGTLPASLATLVVIGLMGAGHCAGMCGGIASALGFAAEGGKTTRLVAGYNLGRILSYACAGAMVAALGYWGQSYLAIAPWLRLLAGILLVCMGLYLADWWRGLVALEKAGSRLWRHIQPLGNRLLPVRGPGQAVLLGMLWGWLPCGLVYSALAYAAASADPLSGALLMTGFGLGTAPAMVFGGLFSGRLRQWVQRRWLRRIMAVVMVVFGMWTMTSGLQHLLPVSGSTATPHQHH